MRHRAALSGVALMVGSVIASLVVPAAPSADAAPTRTIWREQSVCAPATSGRATCHAVALVAHTVSATAKLAATDVTTRETAALPRGLRGPAGGFSPAALAAAYGYNPASSSGAQQVIAIVDACYAPNIDKDLATFDTAYKLPAETADTFKVMRPTRNDQCVTQDRDGWSVETTLDVQAVRGVCQRCKILLVEAPSAGLDDLASAVDVAARFVWTSGKTRLRVTAISNSYGAAENNPGLPQNYAAHYRHPGIAVVAANGDDGWYGWDTINDFGGSPEGAAEVPASLPTVVGVGGTRLTLTTSGARASESVWNENGNSDSVGRQNGSQGATGGGCSRLHAAPGWQRSVATYASLRCSTKRNSTDIAAVGDPRTGFDIYVTAGLLDRGWMTVGGTSLSAPVIAAMWGLAGGTGGVRVPALSLYGHYRHYPHSVFDVTRGGNAFCGEASVRTCAAQWRGNPNTFSHALVDCAFAPSGSTTYPTSTGCRAAARYDGPTGVGTPNGLRVFRPLAPNAVITPPSRITHGARATFSGARSSDPFPGGQIVSWAWSWGDRHGRTTTTPTASHTYATAGTYKVRLTVTDNYGRVSGERAVFVRAR